MSNFDIGAQVDKELQSFFDDTVYIAGIDSDNGTAKYLKKGNVGYQFSQRRTLHKAELYKNSMFEKGHYDTDGTRKMFLNVCAFRADVAAKQVDLDVKDIIFVPEDYASINAPFFLRKDFKLWTKENEFGQLLNDIAQDYANYGTVVVKKVGKTFKRVPLRTLRNQQDAVDLKTARFVIEEHKDMTAYEMKQMKGWDLSRLDMQWDAMETVYERYGHVPKAFTKMYKGETPREEDWTESHDTVTILILKTVKENGKERKVGHVLFHEAVTDRPYEEAHWKRQDGRWLGVGEIENQFENQIAQNTFADYRRRAMMWSSKKLFQARDTNDELPANLVREVADGQVIKIGVNGDIQPVNMTTASIGEFQSAENLWEQNSNQKSFTFEVATGEALPSGTPFRLGVLLSNAANSHFGLKRENLALFVKRLIRNHLYRQFANDKSQEHTLMFASDEEGVEMLKRALITNLVHKEATERLLSGRIPNISLIKQEVEREINNRTGIFFKVRKDYYKTINVLVDIVISGESMDLPKQIETLTTLYTQAAQQGNPKANAILEKALAMTGISTPELEARTPQQTAQQPAGIQIAEALRQEV